MTESRTDLIFHPVRMRVLQALLRGGRMTTAQLGARLGDVPHATLYRHVGRLADGGVIEVVAERPVRGGVERVYAVSAAGGAHLSAREVEHAGAEDHVRYFALFLAGLLGEFERYVGEAPADLERDGAGYRQFPLHLSDAELRDLLHAMDDLIRTAMRNAPRPDRRLRVLTRILMPSTGPAPTDPR